MASTCSRRSSDASAVLSVSASRWPANGTPGCARVRSRSVSSATWTSGRSRNRPPPRTRNGTPSRRSASSNSADWAFVRYSTAADDHGVPGGWSWRNARATPSASASSLGYERTTGNGPSGRELRTSARSPVGVSTPVGADEARLGPLDLGRDLGREQRALAAPARQHRHEESRLAVDDLRHRPVVVLAAAPQLRQRDGMERSRGDLAADPEAGQAIPEL